MVALALAVLCLSVWESTKRKMFTSTVIRKAIHRKSEGIWLGISSTLFGCLLKPLYVHGINFKESAWSAVCQKCGEAKPGQKPRKVYISNILAYT